MPETAPQAPPAADLARLRDDAERIVATFERWMGQLPRLFNPLGDDAAAVGYRLARRVLSDYPADAGEPLTWEWLVSLPGADHVEGPGAEDDCVQFAVGRPGDCDHGIATVLSLTIPDADGWVDAALLALRGGVLVASVRLGGRLYWCRGDVRDLLRGLGLRTDLDR